MAGRMAGKSLKKVNVMLACLPTTFINGNNSFDRSTREDPRVVAGRGDAAPDVGDNVVR